MANSQRSFCSFFVLLTALIYSSHAYRFIVGGKDGWVLNPSENYNHWAERMRFQVNDTLFFKYGKGSDSVMVVSKDDYDKCNTEKPIMKMEDGDSVFQFDRSGPFFFISGKNGSCEKGQKLIIIVLALRHQKKSPPGAAVPAPVGQTPSAAPPSGSIPLSPSPTQAITPVSPSTSPLSPSPVANPPAVSPTPSRPVQSPTPATSPYSPSPSAPAIAPESPSPSNSPAVSPAPEIHAPAPAPSSSSAFTPSIVLLSSISLVLSVSLGHCTLGNMNN